MNTRDPIEEGFRQEQEKLNKRRADWKKYKQSLASLVTEVQKVEADLGFSDYGWLTLNISGDKHKLAAVVRALRTRGYKTEEEPPKKGQSSWNPLFYRDDSPTVYLTFTSTACRMVKVGTKMVEQAVYETVCDELVLDENAA
jgi:hypothetical protein